MKVSDMSRSMQSAAKFRELTSGGVTQLDNIETLAANGTAVRSFHPRFQTDIMENMPTGK